MSIDWWFHNPDAGVLDISPRPPVTVDVIAGDIAVLAEEAQYARDVARHGERVAQLFSVWRLPRRGKPANPLRAARVEALIASLPAGSCRDVAASLATKPRPRPKPLRASAVSRRGHSILVRSTGDGLALTASGSPTQPVPSFVSWFLWERRLRAEASLPADDALRPGDTGG
jgi:hypothetical protein